MCKYGSTYFVSYFLFLAAATDPSQRRQKRRVSNSFETNPEGKLVITEEEAQGEKKEIAGMGIKTVEPLLKGVLK